MGNTPFAAGFLSDLARKPVMAVDQIVVNDFLPPESVHLTQKADQVREEFVFRSIHLGTHFNGDQPHLLGHLEHLAGRMAVSDTGENVHAVTAQTELPGEFADVDAHPSGVLGAEPSQRARMHADHGDGICC